MKKILEIENGRFTHLILFLLLSLALTACGGSEPDTLRIAVLPIMDTLPMYVAQEQGYFAEENLTVEFIPVPSAPARDQLIQSGEADGMVNELMSTMFYNSEDVRVVSVRFARKATPDFPHFYVLASGASGITDVAGLSGQEIGISQGTIIEYSTDRLLTASGLAPSDIKTIAVPAIPERMALLGSGEIAAANLPDPLAALAVQNGATIIVDDAAFPEYGHSVITFRKELLDESPEAVTGFLSAIEKAVNDINSDKTAWSSLLTEQGLVPAPLLESYVVPDYPTASVPSQAQWNDMLQWATEKGYLNANLAYEDSVDDSFLP